VMKLTPAATKIWTHLQNHGDISPVEAQTVYHVADLAGRIMEIRKALKDPANATYANCSVLSKFKKDPVGHRYVRYALEVEMPEIPGVIYVNTKGDAHVATA
jgi:hypothetical protein